MSRSYKKDILKDSKPKNNSYNKAYRRVNKINITQGKDPILMNELVNQYDICDFKFINCGNEYKRK